MDNFSYEKGAWYGRRLSRMGGWGEGFSRNFGVEIE
jgi:hypothetical protein